MQGVHFRLTRAGSSTTALCAWTCPTHYSQDPPLCSITNRGAASCLLSGNLAVWHEVCDSKKTPLSFLCLVMSLLGRLHVVLAFLRLVQGVHLSPFVGHLLLCSWVRRKADLMRLPQLRGSCVSVSTFLQSLKHDTFQNASALSILLPPTSVPFPVACEMDYS